MKVCPWSTLLLFVLAYSQCVFGQEPVTIEVVLGLGGSGISIYEQIAREYEKVRPEVKVNLHGDPRMPDKLRIRTLDGSFPEISDIELGSMTLMTSGILLELNEYLDGSNWEGDKSWRDSFLPGTLENYAAGGRIYSVPLGYFSHAIWYNKKMFRQHRWRTPETWDDLFDLCEKIDESGISPIAFQGRYVDYANLLINSAYLQSAGLETLHDRERLKPGTHDNAHMVRSLGLVQKLALNYFQKGSMGMSHTEAQMQFFLGNAAMILCGSWLKSEMHGKIPEGFELGAFNFPSLPDGKAPPDALSAGPTAYYVFRDCRHPEIAVDFLRFMTSRKMASLFTRSLDIPTAVVGANEGNLSKDLQDMERMIAKAPYVYYIEPNIYYPEFNQHWVDALYDLLVGRTTPEAMARHIEETAATIVANAETPEKIVVRNRWKPALLLLILFAAIAYVLATQARALKARKAQPVGLTRRLRVKHVLLFLGPSVVLYTLFVIVPSMKAFALSTRKWDGLTEMESVGIRNFLHLLFENEFFWTAFGNNLFLMFIPPLFILPLALFFAACISRGVWGQRTFRVAFFFPNILGIVAISLLWLHIYNPQGGLMNTVLVNLGRLLSVIPAMNPLADYLMGFDGFAWLSQDHLYWAIIPMSVWGGIGFFMVLFLAAMEGIPRDLYEAAEIDGATHWRQFWFITFPLIWDLVSIAVVFTVIGGMKAFEVIWLLTNQAPVGKNHVLGTLLVQNLFVEFRAGQAAAIGVLLFVIVFFMTVATMRLLKRETVELA